MPPKRYPAALTNQKKRICRGVNPLVVLVVCLLLLSAIVPILEMLYGDNSSYKPPRKYKPPPEKEQNSHSDQYEPEDDEPVRPRFFLYTEKELSKTKMKDLKTILWGKSISYADLREKKEYIARIMQRVQKDLKRMTRKELRAALEARDIPFQSTMDHAELIQQFLNG